MNTKHDTDLSVLVVERTRNSKLGDIAATYAPIVRTCPTSCPLQGAGCYAETHYIGAINSMLSVVDASEETIAQQEAEGIDVLPGDRPLRVHISGDCRTKRAAEIVGAAMSRYEKRSGHFAYTYTHSWREVPRAAWGEASVMASCDSLNDIQEAQQRGYATSAVVDQFKQHKAYELAPGVKGIPCPQQYDKTVTCESCKLCPNIAAKNGKSVILFELLNYDHKEQV